MSVRFLVIFCIIYFTSIVELTAEIWYNPLVWKVQTENYKGIIMTKNKVNKDEILIPELITSTPTDGELAENSLVIEQLSDSVDGVNVEGCDVGGGNVGGGDSGKGLKGKFNNWKNSLGIPLRNLLCFSLGTLGRDFLYNFFSAYLLSFILLTKNLTDGQFASISIIIICARVFDAFNDPIMGGIVENTRTKWGKYKPWQLIGAVLTGAVIIALFTVDLEGWAFIGFLAVMYFLFSITFTMNDISYWGMMPTLTSNPNGRNTLTSFAQLLASAGGGLAGLLIPALTVGQFALPGGAVEGYKVIAIVAALLMVGFQLFTIFGVKEKALPANFVREKRMGVVQMFRTIAKNDQLVWCTLVMLIFCVGTQVVTGGLSMMYIYFEFGYSGGLTTLFAIGYSITSTVFMVIYPWLSKKFGRNKVLYSTGFAIILGYALMLLFGLTMPASMSTAKFVLMLLAFAIVGYGQGFYMIMVVNMANTVEYNEFKTGRREEGLLFSLRPFTAKMGSALMQGVVMVAYIAAGVLTYTNAISGLENQHAAGEITEKIKLDSIAEIINNISSESKLILLLFMCLVPIVALAAALIIYKKKCFLSEAVLADMIAQTAAKKSAENPENDCTDADGENVAVQSDSIAEEGENAVDGDVADEIVYNQGETAQTEDESLLADEFDLVATDVLDKDEN